MTNEAFYAAAKKWIETFEHLTFQVNNLAAASATLDKKRGRPTLVTKSGKPGPKAKRKPVEASKVVQGPAKSRGRKPLFSDEVAKNMANAIKDGTPAKEVANTYHTSMQTLQRTIARVNGASA